MKRALFALCLAPLVVRADVPVTTALLSDLLVTPELSAPASVVARSAPTLASELDARIESIPVHVGDRLAAGDLVAHLDCRIYESRLRAARATLGQLDAQRELAARQLKRAVDLQSKKGISDEVVEQRQADLASLESQTMAQQESIAQAAIQVERCSVASPFPAVVTERLADAGSLANPGTPLVKLVQLDDLEVSAELRPGEANQIQAAAEVWLDYEGGRFPLQLRRLVPVVDQRSRTQEARFVFAERAAPPGASGRLAWRTADSVIPAEYVVRRDGKLGIFYLNDGRAHFHPLPGALEGQPVAVSLPHATRVIVEGRQRLADGDTVMAAD